MNDPSFIPRDAPPNPALLLLIRSLLFCVGGSVAGYVVLLSFLSSTYSLLVVVVCVVLAIIYFISVHNKAHQFGWYELKPIQFSFPFDCWDENQHLIFSSDGIITGKKDRMLYSQMTQVETLCVNFFFMGAKIYFVDGRIERITNYSGDGEPARTAIALLRDRASHAQFVGPRWIGDGYVPRPGFGHVPTGD